MARSKWWLHVLIQLGLLSPIVGCAKEYDIHYFSLLDSMTPSAFGRPELSDSRNTKEVPIEYFLERDLYVLKVRIDSQSIPPSVIFSVESKSGAAVILAGQHLRCFVQVQPVYDFEVQKGSVPAGSIRAAWTPVIGPPCEDATPPHGDEAVITLSVALGDSGVDTTESIHFKILKNGKHLEIDSF